MEPSSLRNKPRHAIGIVARRTDLPADLIRAWERRYGVVEPARSETRRRLYSDAQVDRLRLLRRAVDGGRRIGDVAALSDAELEQLITDDRSAEGQSEDRAGQGPGVGRRAIGAQAPTQIDEALGACAERIRRLDQGGLMHELERASVTLSRTHLLERLIGPLLERIGQEWRDGRLRPIQEHMASAVIRSFVGELIKDGAVASTSVAAPRVVVATPSGQSHEIGALLVAASAAAEGWQAIYLGPEVAAAEIAAGSQATAARVVALSIVYPPDDPSLGEELASVGRLLPDGVELLVGGREAPSYRAAVEAAGGRLIGGLDAFRRHLAGARVSAPVGR